MHFRVIAQDEGFTFRESPAYLFTLVQFIIPVHLPKFSVLKMAEPAPPHFLFFLWRSVEVAGCGWIALDFLEVRLEHIWRGQHNIVYTVGINCTGPGSDLDDSLELVSYLRVALGGLLLLGLVLWLVCLLVPRVKGDVTSNLAKDAVRLPSKVR